MKTAIRSWLGISEIERTVREIEAGSATEKETKLRKLVGEAIGAALDGKTDSEWFSVVEKKTLQRALEKASVETASNVAKFETEKRVGGEAFIDEIVARIQRKQLGA